MWTLSPAVFRWVIEADLLLLVKSLALHNCILQTKWKVRDCSCHAGEMHKCSLVVLAVSSWNVSFLGCTHLQCFAGKSHLWETGRAWDKCSDRRHLNTRQSLDYCHLGSLYIPHVSVRDATTAQVTVRYKCYEMSIVKCKARNKQH